MQAVLLLSGSWQIRKHLVLCMSKPAIERHPQSTAFTQEGSVLKELFSALFFLSMSLSTKDYPYHSNFGTGNIKSLDASPQSSIYWFNTVEKQQQPLLLEVFSLLHSRQLMCQKQFSWGMCWLRQPFWVKQTVCSLDNGNTCTIPAPWPDTFSWSRCLSCTHTPTRSLPSYWHTQGVSQTAQVYFALPKMSLRCEYYVWQICTAF